MSDTVSSTRLYLGNLPRDVAKEDIQEHFKDASGKILDIKLMTGFGFIEYEDPIDARDIVPDGTELKGSRLKVQFARGSRQREFPAPDHPRPHPRRTPHRMQISGLPGDTSWQDLKDFARRSALDVVYSEISRDRDGKGFVEFENANDLKTAVDKLHHQDFKGSLVECVADPQPDIPRNDRYRSRSPPPFRNRGYPPQDGGYYDRRGPPPRGYSPPRRDHYRHRSPPPREYDYNRGSYRSPPPPRGSRGPPLDDAYPPPPRGSGGGGGGYGRDDPYGAPPRRGGYDDPYATNGYGHGRPRERSPPPPRGYGEYDERAPPPRGYW